MTSGKFKSTVFGEYLMDQFFFKVFTNEKKTVPLGKLNLKKLQSDHIVSIVHEYMHYVHEVSTHVGTLCLNYAVSYRAILSKYVSRDLSSSSFDLNISLADVEYLASINDAIEIIVGDISTPFEIKAIVSYELSFLKMKVPYDMVLEDVDFEVPVLTVENAGITERLNFGKFFIYEGIAYEVELLYAKMLRRDLSGDEDGSEYTILRYLTKHLSPDMSVRTMLVFASLSLGYVNCGGMLVSMLNGFNKHMENGGTEESFIAIVKKKVSIDYAERCEMLHGVLNEIAEVYKYRSSLKIAFDELKQNYLNAALQRIANPAFEVEMILDGRLDQLLEAVPPCDYMFVFTNKNKFLRDFYGTTKARKPNGIELATHHNIFIAHTHYANVIYYSLTGDIEDFNPGDEEVCCPFYTSCDLKYRKENSKLCIATPWKTYDLAYKTDKLNCWYGSGVALFKGIDIDPK